MSGNTLQQTNPDLVNWLSAHFQGRYEPQFGLRQAMSLYRGLPQLRGFWPMSSVDENGAVYDLSGQGRTLTNNNAATFGVDGLAPYVEFDGVNQYLSRADEAGLDVTSVTVACWFNADAIDTNILGSFLMCKSRQGVGTDQAFYLHLVSGTPNQILFTVNAAHFQASVSDSGIVTGTWIFAAGSYDELTGIASVYYGTTKDTDSGTPAPMFNSGSEFRVGANKDVGGSPSNQLDGKIALSFLCATALSDAAIFALYEQTRPLFNV